MWWWNAGRSVKSENDAEEIVTVVFRPKSAVETDSKPTVAMHDVRVQARKAEELELEPGYG